MRPSSIRRIPILATSGAVALFLAFPGLVIAGAATPTSVHQPGASYRAFSASSYWNTALAASAPVDANSEGMIAHLKATSSKPFLRLAGTESSGGWGEPIYWAATTDPVYNVIGTRWSLPPEFGALRIPKNARAAATNDAQMTIYNLSAGAVYKLQGARYDPAADTWSADGGAYYYLSSNGLHGSLAESDEPRNRGHRGVPPYAHAVRWDEVASGSIDHVLKIATSSTSGNYVWPMVGSDGSSTHLDAVPQGAHIRIKPSVDLSKLRLSPAALTVARALQTYGAVIGDSSGGPTTLKVENTVAEGRGWLWQGVLSANSLRSIPLDYFEVVKLDYDPSDA